ncbi:MAG: hypothetical protein KDA24_15745 [Deltaproteobacteria bacterium]|nr:hypothetical protein [Deltaproteobacteria bacterium]
MKAKPSPKLSCMMPTGRVLTPGDRFARFGVERPSGATYSRTEGLDVGFPIVPMLPFGLTYELDLVFMTKHPSWNMHEYALIRTSAGLVWLAKDAREGSLEQTIIAGVDNIDDWMPEVPVQRRHQAFDVIEAIGPDSVELSFDYVNWDGERTEVWFEGPFPKSARPKRNGSTMGHSRGQLMAVLDLPFQNLGRKGHVTIAGQRQKPARILGIPVTAALQQTQGGLVTGSWLQRSAEGGFTSDITARSGAVIPRSWTLSEVAPSAAPSARDGAGPSVYAVQRDPDREIGARFLLRPDGAQELVQLWSWQLGQSSPGFVARFCPALPDLRRRFDGEVVVEWVGDVAGQLSHARGTAVARWTDEGPEVELRPAEPWWVWDRAMRTTVRLEGEGVRVDVQRMTPVGSPPSHGRCVQTD